MLILLSMVQRKVKYANAMFKRTWNQLYIVDLRSVWTPVPCFRCALPVVGFR